MRISNHRMNDIWYGSSNNISAGTISPKLIITHYTTGWNGEGSRNWLMGKAGGTTNKGSSAHVVIDRNGTAWQIVPFNRRAWHAGPSRYGNLSDINSHSIGIEFVNPGWLQSDGHGGWVDSYNVRKSSDELEQEGGYLQKAHPRVRHAPLVWPFYTKPQIERGIEIVRAIADKYGISNVVTHEEIDTRGIKTDPGPAFPQSVFIEQVTSRRGSAEPRAYKVSATRLNIRGGPGIDFELMEPPGQLPRGTVVKEIRREPSWVFIETAKGADESVPEGMRGWVSSDYLELQFDV